MIKLITRWNGYTGIVKTYKKENITFDTDFQGKKIQV